MGDTCLASPQLRGRFRHDNGQTGADGGGGGCRKNEVLVDKTATFCNGQTTRSHAERSKMANKTEKGYLQKDKISGVTNPVKTEQVSSKDKNLSKKDAEQENEKNATGGTGGSKKVQQDAAGGIGKSHECNNDFSRMSAEEQVLIVRHKLEKIIHGREKDETKALNLLRILERTGLTKDLVDATKIDLTLEAMNFIIKDPNVRRKTEKVLRKIKQPAVVKDLRELSSTGWRDSEKPKLEERVISDSPMMKLGYWMDKLMDTGKTLDSLDKQLDNVSKNVKKSVHQPPDSTKKADVRSKSPTVDDLLSLKDAKVDDDLDGLSAGLNKMLLAEKKKEKEKKCEENEKELRREKDIAKEIESIIASVSGVSLETQAKAGDKDTNLFADPEIIVVKKDAAKIADDKTGESSLTKRIKAAEVVKRLSEIKESLDIETDPEENVINNLKYLESSVITFQQLQDTKIGVSLNMFRKKTENPEIILLAKKVLRTWKKLIPVQSKKEEAVVVADDADITTSKTVDEVRSHCRKTILAALRQNESLPERLWVNTVDLSRAIEETIFAMFKEMSMKYRNQVNSRVYNIKANLTLQENLLLGNIGPEELAAMTHEEMASDDLKKIRAELVKKGFEAVVTAHDADDMFCTCRICLPPFLHA